MPLLSQRTHYSPQSRFVRRSQQSFQPSVYVPIICIVVVLVLVVVISSLRQRLRRSHIQSQPSTAVAANATHTPVASNRRRSRRNRRRPSQVSVTSLPLYMEEAGETELVLVRGDRDLQDEMPLEDSTNRQVGSHEELDSFEENGTNAEDVYSALSRPSTDSQQQAGPSINESSDSLPDDSSQHVQGASQDHRVSLSETPSYAEAVQAPSFSGIHLTSSNFEPSSERRAPTLIANNQSGPSSYLPPTALTPESTASHSRRLQTPISSLRSLFGKASGRNTSGTSSSRPPQSHAATLSRSLSRTRLLEHQRSMSGNSMSSSLHLSPTTSRVSQAGNPNASLLSLSSISQPLAHTLTRTEISYPKTGPTPEQMKFLGSRESLVRGDLRIPWGDAAVKWMSATLPDWSREVSRSDLHDATQTSPRDELPHLPIRSDESMNRQLEPQDIPLPGSALSPDSPLAETSSLQTIMHHPTQDISPTTTLPELPSVPPTTELIIHLHMPTGESTETS